MKYRIVLNFKIYPFDNYSEALKFKLENGGVLYEQVLY